MSSEVKYTENEARLIVEHNLEVIAWADNALANLKVIPKPMRNEQWENMYQYYKHCRAALKWSNHRAMQKRIKNSNVNRSTIQQPRSSTI